MSLGRWEVVAASASFFAAKAVADAATGNFTFHDVIGPDESAGVVNDSAYTNAAAQRSLRWAAEAWGHVSGAFFSPDVRRRRRRQRRWQRGRQGRGGVGPSPTRCCSPGPLPRATVPRGPPRIHRLRWPRHQPGRRRTLQYPWYWSADVARDGLAYYGNGPRPAARRGSTSSSYGVAWLRLGATRPPRIANSRGFKAHRRGGRVRVGETLQEGGGNLNFLTGAGWWLQLSCSATPRSATRPAAPWSSARRRSFRRAATTTAR